MNFSAEARFVADYIRKEKRERLLYELTNAKKRYRGLDRFCHHASELIDPAKIAMQGDEMKQTVFERFVAAHPGDCALLSPDAYLDERTLPLREAVTLAFCGTDAAIILGQGFAIVIGEAEKGGREQYLLMG